METTASKKGTRRLPVLSVLTLVLCAGLFAYLWKIEQAVRGMTPSSTQSGWDAARMREYANRLKAEGLADQAVEAFEAYLGSGSVDSETRANVYYALGEMLFQHQRYEDALSYFYKTEVANPDFPLKSDLGTYVVACLENMGKALDAEYQLESRTSLSGEPREKKASGETVARIGNREITMGEVNAQLAKLPPWLADEYTKDESKKLEFLKNYVAGELLYDKGRKLGLEKSPEVRERIAEYTKELVTQQVISQEITAKVAVDEDDLKNYYEAHREKYLTKPRLKCRHILVDSEEQAEELLASLNEGNSFEDLATKHSKDETTKATGGTVAGWVYQDSPPAAFDYDGAATERLFALSVNAAPEIIESPKGVHLVQVIDKEPARQQAFSEVRSQVEYEYRKQKEARLTQELLASLLKAKDVEIYAAKFLPVEPGDAKEDTPQAEATEDQGS